jgi:ElaB/YqjD/DUF883 family membrane-anchored ribosome-binding protein
MLDKIERTKDGMDSLIDRTRDGVVGANESAERGVEAAARVAVKQAHVAGDRTREGAAAASRSAHRQVAGAANAIDRGYTRARSDLTRAATSATDYVTENPGKAVLFAASTGFAIGVLMPRSRRAD